ncbi:MAG TPA: protein phosphatase 2C domain-containing protein [Candidatus Binataceae bacterium]|nr:protein phosphatase 2C domain-containing protein [Candidatus Binataceae bacterium]
MITCPDCGQTAPDEAQFCEQCGRGLHDLPPPAVALPPLPIGKELHGRFRVVEVISQSSQENRYRAVALDSEAARFILRERIAPAAQSQPVPEAVAETATAKANPDPSGPLAKTRDLAPLAGAATAQQETPSASAAVATESTGGALQDVQAEVEPAQAPSFEPNAQAETALPNGDGAEGNEKAPPASTGEQPIATAEAQLEADHNGSANGQATPEDAQGSAPERADLGEVFERVLALSQTITHPAYSRAREGFAEDGRAYLVYGDEQVRPFVSQRQGSTPMPEHQALNLAIQICQAVSYLHSRGMRVNDICPASLAFGADGRVKLTSLDYISNDNELQSDPILNDGYTAPEIYRGKSVDKRADVFSAGCVLYTCLTGERIECETWREDASPIRFYPPHVVSPDLEKLLRRALAFRPADRWPGADQFKAELLKLGSHLEIRSGSLTHVGMVREANEDSLLALEYFQDSQIAPGRHYLYVVSDGMGGAAAGETASAIAVETIQDYVEKGLFQRSANPQPQSSSSSETPAGAHAGNDAPGKPARPLDELLQAALEEANRKVVEYQAVHPELRGMGATAVSALVAPPEVVIAWVGDSRAYLYEGGKLRQLSKDHSLVQRLVEIGQITAEEARYHEHKNVITRSLGARVNGPAGAEALKLRLKRGDRLMLCSDGLIAHVEDSAIAEVLARREDPVAASRELVVAANAGGGTDNISVIVIDAE